MRARLLLCLPIAAVLTFVILGLGASFGSAVATRLTVSPPGPRIQLAGYVASPAPGADPAGTIGQGPGCAQAKDRLASLVRSAIRCDDDPRCLASPLFCPIELEGRAAREVERLRRLLADRCDSTLGGSGGGSHPGSGIRAPTGDAVDADALPGTSVLLELDGCGYSAEPPGTPDLGPSPRTYQF